MASEPQGPRKVVGFIDLGTNSVRLLVVAVNANASYTVLRRDKEVVRLGEGEFNSQRLQPEAMERAALVCAKFRQLAESCGATEVHAVATAASREAKNKAVFLGRLKRIAKLDARVVSGKEEARLIYLGVAGGLKLGERKALFVDIGGGSTELIHGDQHAYDYLETLRLGAIRLSTEFLDPKDGGPVGGRDYNRIRKHVRNRGIRAIQRLRAMDTKIVIGSSGTIENLCDVTAHRVLKRPLAPEDVFTFAQLRKTIEFLRELPLKERKKVPGLNPTRADIIIAGSAIFETLLEDLDVKEIRASDRGLQDGLLLDYLSRQEHFEPFKELSIRERSVLRLGRLCQFDEDHARNVARIALGLFDSARLSGLHGMGEAERELLEYAALLHEIGVFLSYTGHQAHSHYFIKNADLLGFNQEEVDVIATTALFHRKPGPRKSHADFAALEPAQQETVMVLAMLLRLAESLDRCHSGFVREAVLRAIDKKTVALEVKLRQDAPLELWGVKGQAKGFRKTFGRKLVIEDRTLAKKNARAASEFAETKD